MLSRVLRASFNTQARAAARHSPAPGDFCRRSIHSTTSLKLDYYEEIMVDHNNFRDLHARFIQAYKNKDEHAMTNIANTFVHEAALHSDGEELSVYKALDQKHLHDCAEKDREAHQLAKQALKHVDSNSIASLGIMEYANAVERAFQIIFDHAKEEEQVHYKKLSATLTDDEKASLAKDFLKARKMAPTRPHPSAPQHGGAAQKIAGAMAKPLDAVITATRERVPLKHVHSDA